ncbi:hypothetical protein ABH931_006093 [Streptacidiphilus sp. MAP12-33]|uniref:hypothetical protein n=1 Tax=Streptacidiphilus sp. MAP12-33 TaxID=3156266 RepID=UPI0035115BEB
MTRQVIALTLAPFVIICAVVAVGILSALIHPKPPRPPRRDKTPPLADEPGGPRQLVRREP